MACFFKKIKRRRLAFKMGKNAKKRLEQSIEGPKFSYMDMGS
jgi:hypothetical protein